MKNKGRLLILASIIIACLVSTAVILLLVGEFNPDRLKSGVFWLCFIFAIPVNMCAAIVLHLWSGHRGSKDIVHMPVVYYIIAVFGVLYLGVGYYFIFKWNVTKITGPLIAEIVITGAYIVVALVAMFGADYISSTQREVKEKVLYIRMLQADVDDCRSKTSIPAISKALERLSQNVECSDPMSHASLAGIESSLTATVAKISGALSTEEPEEEILKMIADAEALLDSRNRRCIMLK